MIVKTMFNGKEADAEVMNVKSKREAWGKLLLDDGTTVKIRFDVISLLKLVNETDVEGNAIYIIQGSTKVDVKPPKKRILQ